MPGDGREGQGFQIYKITKPINGIITIYAEHISYQLSSIPVSPFTATSTAEALTGLSDHAAVECPFTFWTDKTTSADFAVTEPSSIRSRLGGVSGSILDVYGGEYEFNNYTVKLWNKRGADNGVALRYGKNITDLEQEENISNTITGIYPYWKGAEEDYVELPEKVILSDKAENYPYPRIAAVDFSGEFEEKPTEAQLRSKSETYIKQSGIGVPTVSIKVSFIALWQTEEYKEIAPLERVQICDDVTVEFDQLGVSTKAEVIKTVYNVLLDRYDTIELGESRTNLASDLVYQQQEISKKPSTSFLQNAVTNATNWITGANGGYVVLHKNADGQPYEILILDTPDISTAKDIWRWNQGGLGHSKNGYSGPYTTAITQDGQIVADFITAGTMMANVIKGGILTLGGSNNTSGVCQVLDENGKVIVKMDRSGVTSSNAYITGGKIKVTCDNDQFAMIEVRYGSGDDARKTIIKPYGVECFGKMSNGKVVSTNITASLLGVYEYTGNSIDEPGYGYGMSTIDYYNGGILRGLQVLGDLSVNGTKSRIVKTESYGNVLQNAYETAEPYFGDIGYGRTDMEGKKYIKIDPVFAETVTLSENYAVFVQAENNGEIYVTKKSESGFWIYGPPETDFVYEIKGKQKGYESIRLKEVKNEPILSN